MTRVTPIGLLHHRFGLNPCDSRTWNHERLTLSQRMFDLNLELTLQFSGDFHGIYSFGNPREAWGIPFFGIDAYSVMRAIGIFAER